MHPGPPPPPPPAHANGPPPLPPPAQAAVDGADDDDDLLGDDATRHPQRYLSAHMTRLTQRLLVRDLQRQGAAARPRLAQLRSQSGRGALSWLDVPPSSAVAMTSVAAATMTLVVLFVEPWRIAGDTCVYGCPSAGPTCLHVLGCARQSLRGQVPTHQAMKCALQQQLRSCGAPYFLNEDTMASDYDGDQIDTLVLPGTLHMCGDADFARKGVAVDNSVCAPTASTLCRRAAAASGAAARARERDKYARYGSRLNPERYLIVPFVQESFGRLGPAASRFIGVMAAHAAARAGGGERVVRRRRGIVRRRIVVTLSAALARELAERILAYVHGARLRGRAVRPVSRLLHVR